jgi:hypothetical protein
VGASAVVSRPFAGLPFGCWPLTGRPFAAWPSAEFSFAGCAVEGWPVGFWFAF